MVLLMCLTVWATGEMARAESASVLLEKGIYAEETAGNVDEAMSIYQKIIADEQANRQAAAQAYYRLGKCYQKKGDNNKAVELFQKLIANYPEQKELIEKVKSFVPATLPSLTPKVVKTNPVTLANDVSPSLKEMTVSFDQPMKDNSWAWCRDTGKAKFPETPGKPHYDSTQTTNYFPVQLEPGTVYWVSLNTPGYIGFISANGVATPQYVILFATKDKDGKPTPIPEELIAQAKSINAAGKQAAPNQSFTKPVKIEPAPWQDGEAMRLKLNTPAGMEIGTLIWTAKKVHESQKDLWRIESFTKVPMANMEQYTRVDAGMEDFLPVFGRTKNGSNDFKADYEQGKVKLTTIINEKESARSFPINGTAYDNEEALYLIRRMPLAKDYRGSFQIFPVQSGAPAECRIFVVEKEKVTVGAGTYDCYKVNLAVYAGTIKALEHTLWFSADEHKYLVKYDAGSAIMELAEVSQLPQDQPVKFSDKEADISLTVPAGWFFYKDPTPREAKYSLYLLPPEMKTWAVLMKLDLSGLEKATIKTTVQQIVDGDIEVLKGFFKNYTVRKDSMKEIKVSGLPAIRYAADYEDKGQKKVEYRVYIRGKSQVYWFVFRIDKDQFENNQSEFDSIVNSFEAK
jgi:tetratricopeptide (TPR) repeat protein